MTTPITILVSEDSRDAAAALGRELATALAERLGGAGVSPQFGGAGVSPVLVGNTGKMPVPPAIVLVFPRLVDLPPNGTAVQRLREVEGDLIVLSRLYPRAAYWLLRAHGIDGRFCGGESPTEIVFSRPPRSIHFLDLRCFPDAAAIARSIIIHCAEIGPAADANPTFEVVEDEAAGLPRWHPVIDYDRCTNCLECLNFCLFGTYGLDEAGRILVEMPETCRDGCPACWRICPAGAIIFPACEDPAIAGDDSPPAARGDDLDRLADELDRSEESHGI